MRDKNKQLKDLIVQLSIVGNKSKAWLSVSRDLDKPSRNMRKVNLYKLEKHAKEDLFVVVPGKILGVGNLTKKLNIVCYQASESAIKKVNKVGGKIHYLSEYVKKNPEGKGIMILG